MVCCNSSRFGSFMVARALLVRSGAILRLPNSSRFGCFAVVRALLVRCAVQKLSPQYRIISAVQQLSPQHRIISASFLLLRDWKAFSGSVRGSKNTALCIGEAICIDVKMRLCSRSFF